MSTLCDPASRNRVACESRVAHGTQSSIYLSIYLSTHPSIYLSFFQSIPLYICRPVSYMGTYLSIHQALMVGMGEEMEHGATNTRLRRLMAEEGLDVQLARDGQLVPLALRSKS